MGEVRKEKEKDSEESGEEETKVCMKTIFCAMRMKLKYMQFLQAPKIKLLDLNIFRCDASSKK